LADRWVAELPSIWSGLCHGQVSVIKLEAGEDLGEHFLQKLNKTPDSSLLKNNSFLV
jgi:hypothetical protein